MIYIAHLDPENIVDLPTREDVCDRMAGNWSDDDTSAVIDIMADYLTGPADGYAKAKLWRKIIERAELVVARDA